MMENIFLTLKAIEFLALEASVFVIGGAVVIAAIYQAVRSKVGEARPSEGVAHEAA